VKILIAFRQLAVNQSNAAKSMERLSSGLRINRAGDDAAGLAISEKMRGQIRGLKQAARNAQDGISLIQTAEGALNETHAILQRMRELAVQAANDTNTDDDRIEIQKEIDQLKSEIDRIGNTTEFNTKRLVDGTLSQKADLTAGGTNLVSAKAVNPMDEGIYEVAVANVSTVAANINEGSTGINDAAMITDFGANVDVGDSFQIVVSNYDSNTKKATVTLLDAAGTQIAQAVGADLTNAIDFGGSEDALTIAANAITGNGTTTLDFGVKADYTVSRAGVQIQQRTGVVSTSGTVDVGGFQLTVDKNLTAGTDATVEVSGKGLQFQIGANENQYIRLALSDMRSTGLGVDQLMVDSYENANDAVVSIDKAIQDVSGERSKLGALQNRLEHTISNLGTSAENLQAAESRIRDLDMAEEIMAFTKNNILQQAATAMLAQANMAPQSVLQLLG
jgi:flagellin